MAARIRAEGGTVWYWTEVFIILVTEDISIGTLIIKAFSCQVRHGFMVCKSFLCTVSFHAKATVQLRLFFFSKVLKQEKKYFCSIISFSYILFVPADLHSCLSYSSLCQLLNTLWFDKSCETEYRCQVTVSFFYDAVYKLDCVGITFEPHCSVTVLSSLIRHSYESLQFLKVVCFFCAKISGLCENLLRWTPSSLQVEFK